MLKKGRQTINVFCAIHFFHRDLSRKYCKKKMQFILTFGEKTQEEQSKWHNISEVILDVSNGSMESPFTIFDTGLCICEAPQRVHRIVYI